MLPFSCSGRINTASVTTACSRSSAWPPGLLNVAPSQFSWPRTRAPISLTSPVTSALLRNRFLPTVSPSAVSASAVVAQVHRRSAGRRGAPGSPSRSARLVRTACSGQPPRHAALPPMDRRSRACAAARSTVPAQRLRRGSLSEAGCGLLNVAPSQASAADLQLLGQLLARPVLGGSATGTAAAPGGSAAAALGTGVAQLCLRAVQAAADVPVAEVHSAVAPETATEVEAVRQPQPTGGQPLRKVTAPQADVGSFSLGQIKPTREVTAVQFQRATHCAPAEVEPTAHAGPSQPYGQRLAEGLIQVPLSGQQLTQHLGPDLPVLAPGPSSGGVILIRAPTAAIEQPPGRRRRTQVPLQGREMPVLKHSAPGLVDAWAHAPLEQRGNALGVITDRHVASASPVLHGRRGPGVPVGDGSSSWANSPHLNTSGYQFHLTLLGLRSLDLPVSEA